jgi:hypothetical protein
VQDYWHYSTTIERRHHVLLQMQQVLQWLDSDMDSLFIAAAKIT